MLSHVFDAVDKTSSSFSQHGKIGNFIIIIVVPPAANAAPAAASWHQIVVAPDLRFSPRCFVLAAASEWCPMERRRPIAQRCSSRFWRESGYMQAPVLGPVLADHVCGRSLVHSNCTIAPQLTRGCRMSGVIRGLSSCLLYTSMFYPMSGLQALVKFITITKPQY